jgi:hypothetical protein
MEVIRRGLALCCALPLVGCANMEVKKVPVETRLSGADHQRGFRYYLSRPYFVVKERVNIRTDYELARMVTLRQVQLDGKPVPGTALALGYQAIVPDLCTGAQRLFAHNGNALRVAKPGEAGWSVAGVVKADDLKPSQPPAPKQNPPKDTKTPAEQSRAGQATEIVPVSLGLPGSPSGLNPAGTPVGRGNLSTNVLPSGPRVDINVPLSTAGKTSDTTVPTAFQVVFLPDFEEQYAIKNCNILAYSKYELHFADGWQLLNAQGSYDSTAIAVAFIKSVGNAITQLANLKTTALGQLAAKSPGAARDLAMKSFKEGEVVVLIGRQMYIEPGMYKLLKSWERDTTDGSPPCHVSGNGVLADMGIPVTEDVKIRLVNNTK